MEAEPIRRATPECEDFSGKYEDRNFISRYLVKQYFVEVKRLVEFVLRRERLESALEVGCGEGFSTQRLRQILPDSVAFTASEYVAEMIPRARQRNPGVDIIREDVYLMNERDNDSFDLIFFLEVLEHLDFPEKAVQELKRVTSRFLIVGVPREPLWRILNMLRCKYIRRLGNTPGHLNHWSKRSICGFIENHFGTILAVRSPLPWTLILAEKC